MEVLHRYAEKLAEVDRDIRELIGSMQKGTTYQDWTKIGSDYVPGQARVRYPSVELDELEITLTLPGDRDSEWEASDALMADIKARVRRKIESWQCWSSYRLIEVILVSEKLAGPIRLEFHWVGEP